LYSLSGKTASSLPFYNNRQIIDACVVFVI
jgi:hypothetical protein